MVDPVLSGFDMPLLIEMPITAVSYTHLKDSAPNTSEPPTGCTYKCAIFLVFAWSPAKTDHLTGDQGSKQVHLHGRRKTPALRAIVAGRGAFRCTSL